MGKLRAILCASLVALGTTTACIWQGRGQRDPALGGPNDYVGAGVFAATGVGAAVVNRKLTGDCYASCPAGYVCNHDTGVCDRRSCTCPADQVCEIVGGEVLCTQPRRRLESEIDASASEADAAAQPP